MTIICRNHCLNINIINQCRNSQMGNKLSSQVCKEYIKRMERVDPIRL